MALPPPTFDVRHQWFLSRIVYAWFAAGRPSVTVTSWFRTPGVNADIGGVSNSWHLDGLAMDLTETNAQMLHAARALGLQVVEEGSHVHFEPPWSRPSAPPAAQST